MVKPADAWKDELVVRSYLDGIRGAIPLAAEQIDAMLRLIAASGQPVTSFLDLGCGGGALGQALFLRYPNANATLVDFSEPMLIEARNKLASYGEQCHFITADLAESGWQRGVLLRAPFDAVVSGFAIHHLADDRKQDLYREVYGLLRPGGFFVNVEHVSSPTPWLADVFDELLIDSFLAYHRSIGSDKTRDEVAATFVHRPDKQANILAPVDEQCDWLRACGFKDVDCYFKVFELAVFGGRR